MAGEAHIRIDEGIKRGPRKPRQTIKRRDKETGQALAIIPKDLLPATVIERYLSDERTADIAQSYGVRRSRLNQWLLEHAEESWRKAQVARAITALEDSKDELEAAADPLTLARAREKLRSAQWELERLFSRLYGQKQEVTMTVNTDLGDKLRRSRERTVIDVVPERQDAPQQSTELAVVSGPQIIKQD